MKRLFSMILATATLSACSQSMTPMMASMPQTAPVMAQSDAGVRGAVRSVFENEFLRLDKNKDGFLTKDEITTPNFDFAKADADRDSKLSLKEYLVGASKVSTQQFQALKQTALQSFTHSDANHDGYMSLDEVKAQFTQAPPQDQAMALALTQMSDKNRDKKLSLSEYEDLVALLWASSIVLLPNGLDGKQPAPIGPGVSTGPINPQPATPPTAPTTTTPPAQPAQPPAQQPAPAAPPTK